MWKSLLGMAVLGLLAGCTADRATPAAASPVAASAAVGRANPPNATATPRARGATSAPLPDRGELLVDDRNRKVRHVGAATFYPVVLSEQHALNAIGSKQLVLTSPKGRVLRLAYLDHVEHPGGHWTWIGRDGDGTIGSLTFGTGDVSGTIPQSGDVPLRVGTSAQGAWLATAATEGVADAAGAPFSTASLADPAASMRPRNPGSSVLPLAMKATTRNKALTLAASRGMARHDVDGDGRADIVWTHRAGGGDRYLSIWFMNGAVLQGGRFIAALDPNNPFHHNAEYKISGIADQDGNGVLDLLLLMQPKFPTRPKLMSVVTVPGPDYQQTRISDYLPDYPVGWNMTGLLDMNGDGASDIAWRPEQTCSSSVQNGIESLSRWYMHTATLLGGRMDVFGECVFVRSWMGTYMPGDFNGDGIGDFAISSFSRPQSGGATTETLWMAITREDGSPAIVSGGMKIVDMRLQGSGDLNGDGKADLVFDRRYTGQEFIRDGEIEIWYMDGGSIIGTKIERLPNNYFLAAVADYDGNGYDDLLLSKSDPGTNSKHLVMWLTQADGRFVGSYIGSANQEQWTVVNSTY